MIYFYKFKLWKNQKNKLIFYSKNNLNLTSEISKEENSYKNYQKINFNQKQQFTIKKRFTLDWHTRPTSNLPSGQMSKNKKFLKLASFYSQLNSSDFSKKFTSLMILNLKTQTKNCNDVKQQNDRVLNSDTYISYKINKLPNSIELEKNNKIFSNLQYKDKVWFSKIVLPFSNRNYWWILLPTRSILTHMRWEIFLKQITGFFRISLRPTSSTYSLSKEISPSEAVYRCTSPEFLIEKPVYWYWMLPFFGCIGLVSNNLTLSFFDNQDKCIDYNLQNKVNFNIYSTFSQHQIQNSISWEMFQFFDYKKILFDSSLKYINQLFLNNDTLSIQIKKAWLSRQKEHYICTYQDNLIKKNFNKNFNQLTKLQIIHWWKKNWKEIIYSKYLSQLQENKKNNDSSLRDPQRKILTFNITKNTNFYSFDSLFYSKFYWYWHNLDTKNINNFLNLNYSNPNYFSNGLADKFCTIPKFDFQKILSDYNTTSPHSLFNSKLFNNFLFRFSTTSLSLARRYTVYTSSINEFPLKMQVPWFFDDLPKSKMKQKINCITNPNFYYITEKIDNNLRNIEINVTSQKNNNKESQNNLIEFQIKNFNLKFKTMMEQSGISNFFQFQKSTALKDTFKGISPNEVVYLFKRAKKNTTRSSFLFCISSKNKLMKHNEIVKQNLQLAQIDNVLQNKQSQFTLYNGIGCEVFESELNPIYGWNKIKFSNPSEAVYHCTRANSDIFLLLKDSYIERGQGRSEATLGVAKQVVNTIKRPNYHLKKEYNFEPIEISNSSKMQKNNEIDSFNCMYLKNNQNQSISSFHKASFLLDNIMSKFYFESGGTWLITQYFINYFYKILNIKKLPLSTELAALLRKSHSTSNHEKIIQIQKNPIIMSGYHLPHNNSILQNKNKIINDFKTLKELALLKRYTTSLNIPLRYPISCVLPPNILYNQTKFNNFFKSQSFKPVDTVYRFAGKFPYEGANSCMNIKKQNLCIIKKRFRKIDSKSKKFERFLILNLLKSPQNLFYKSKILQINIKKIHYRKQFFNIKTNYKYQTIRPIKENKNQIIKMNLLLKRYTASLSIPLSLVTFKGFSINTKKSLLLHYSDSIIKEKINSILRANSFKNKPQTTLFSSIVLSDPNLSTIKIEPKRIFHSLNYNNIPKYLYISNQSIFWNYINSTYNSSGFLDTNKPFVFEKFNDFIKNIRIKIANKNNKNLQNWNFFSNLLLQKYQRKNPNWPGGANPQGFFYKRINKLNFKKIKKKQNLGRSEIRNDNEIGNILNFKSNILKQLKNVSGSKPIAELLWEVRTKHKIPEVLLIQQTLFFQKKLVRKSTEENNLSNQYSSADEGLSQKVQTLLRKMTQRRHFRKHVFIETLFDWTRDAISLRKMLRKIYLKNNWQIFFKYILKSKKSLVLSDYYSNWYKYNHKNFVNKNIFSYDGVKRNTTFNVTSQKILKTENIRPFVYKFIQTQNNNKFFQSKNNINFVLKDFNKNISIDFTLLENRINNKFIYNLKTKKTMTLPRLAAFKLQILNFASLRKQNGFSNHPLVFPEWQIFDSFKLLNAFIKIQSLAKRYTSSNWGTDKICKGRNEATLEENIFKGINTIKRSSLINAHSLDPLSFILINRKNNTQDNFLSNELNSYYFINQRNLSKICFPLYSMSNKNRFEFAKINNSNNLFNINKKLRNDTKALLPSFNKKSQHVISKLQSKKLHYFFNLSNIFNGSRYYNILQSNNCNKFFEIENSLNLFDFVQTKPGKPNFINSKLNFSSSQLSIRNRLLSQKLYFTNILWHSTDFVLNSNSTIFNENQLIKNVIKQNWVFQTRLMDAQNFFDRELNLNFHHLLATLSTWQYKFQIRRDLILQLFYTYLDHTGAFINYVIKNIILNNILNQIQNWNFFKQIKIIEPINIFNLEKNFLTKPTWSFDLLNHIKTQYPHLYNQIQIKNKHLYEGLVSIKKSNLTTFNPSETVYLLKRANSFKVSKNQIMFYLKGISPPNFKTQLPVIDSFRKKSGKNTEFLKGYNMFNSINMSLLDQSIIHKISSESLIIQNSTLFCQKWIQNRQLSNLYKIQFLKKQQKLRQILNIFQNNGTKENSINIFSTDGENFYSSNQKKTTLNIGFKRRSGFLLTRSLITTNFNSFSSFSKITRTSISVYLNKNSENISLLNSLFLIQMLLLHICLIFCLITVYQSAFHFCLKSFISLFVILIHYFLNIKYRLKRLIKYVYQSLAQSFITNIQEYFYSFDSLHSKLFGFCNNLSTVIFYNKFSIWGKIYKSSIPSFTHFLFKNPFSIGVNYERTKFLKPKNKDSSSDLDLILSEKLEIQKFKHLQSFFNDVEYNELRNRSKLTLNLKFDLITKNSFLKIVSQKKENNRMSLLRNTNVIQKYDFSKLENDLYFISNKTVKNTSSSIPWEKDNSNKMNLLKKLIKKEKIININKKDSSTFQLSFKLLKWNLGLILLIGESEIFAELEPYREMHWYFLKRLPIFLRSNTYSEDPINMYDYQADEKLRKFKEQFKKSTEIFQKRQNAIERKTERNRKKEHAERSKIFNSSNIQHFELINPSEAVYRSTSNKNFTKKQNNTENIIIFIKSEKQFKEKTIKVFDFQYINKITYLLNNFYFIRKKISRGQPFWKPLFSFFAHTLFVSRLAKLNRRLRDSVLIINYIWIPFGPLTAILCSFLWKNWILNFSNLVNHPNYLVNQYQLSTKKDKTTYSFKGMNSSYIQFIKFLLNWRHIFKQNFGLQTRQLQFSEILESQHKVNEINNLKTLSSYYSPFQVNKFYLNKINNFEYKQFLQEIENICENINAQNNKFSQLSPPLLNRIFLWNFVKFEKKYQRVIFKWINREEDRVALDFLKFSYNKQYLNLSNLNMDKEFITKYKTIYINNQEQSAQNRYIHYQTYDPKVRLYRFYTNFSKNLHDIGIIQDAKNVHPLFGSLLCEIYSGRSTRPKSATKKNFSGTNSFKSMNPRQVSFFTSTKNILLVGNTNSSNFVLLIQAFAAESGLKLFMEDAKRLRRLGRRGINKSTKRLEKLFEIAQAHSPCIVFLEDIDVIGSKRRVIKINEEEEDEDLAIRSFFSKLIYRKQHNYKSLRQSFINQNLFISNEGGYAFSYRNTQKSIIPESPIPSNLIEYQLTRRKAFSNYFSNTSNLSYKSFLTKFNALKKGSTGNFSNNVSSSPTNTVIIWKLLKSKLVTPKKTIKETPWKHIPVDSMRSIPLITYSIRVKVAKLTMLAIYTMNTQLRLVKDLIKLLEKIQYESYKGFIVFATTNKLAILDPSLRRPGRFDETVYLPSLTVNPNYQRFSAIHFLNVLSIDSKDFVNFARTFNIINSMNFAIDWNLNSVYGNVFIQDNSEKIFYPTRTSLRDLINSTADNVYNQNIFMQNENNIYQNYIPFDIWGNIGFQKPSFSIYSKSALLLSLAYSKAGQLIIKLFFQEKYNDAEQQNYNNSQLTNPKQKGNQLAFNSENNQLTIWPNSNIFAQFKKINISYVNRNKNIKNILIHYFAGKIGEFCFFSSAKFSKELAQNQNNVNFFEKIQINPAKKIKINHLFEKNSFGLRSLYGIQSNWKNVNSVIFSLIRTSCLYSKNHLTSKLFYLDDIFKKRQRIFSENFGPSLLFEYFNLNTESFLKRNTSTLEEHLQKQQTQKYLLNLQQKPLRKFLFDSTSRKISKNHSYLNKISNQNILLTENDKNQPNHSIRLALFRILFNELGSLDLITLRPTAMNYYYDKKIYYKQRFRKYTYKWWNWHLKKTIDSLEEFQYLNFFPYADKQYNPRRQRWLLTNGYSAYWLAQEKTLYYQIYEQLIIECFQRSYIQLDRHREMLDYLVQLLMTKQLLTEIQWILFFKRFEGLVSNGF
uniref:Cell division protein n=1 Tax=Oedocladium carolinianum TaxID=55992 RepID=A0A8K1JC82_9CHLO|nr:cell division protein [Oedocladium carolinianum]